MTGLEVGHQGQSFGGANRQKVNHPSQYSIKLIHGTVPKVQRLASQIVVTGSSIQISQARNHRERLVKLEETSILGNIAVC